MRGFFPLILVSDPPGSPGFAPFHPLGFFFRWFSMCERKGPPRRTSSFAVLCRAFFPPSLVRRKRFRRFPFDCRDGLSINGDTRRPSSRFPGPSRAFRAREALLSLLRSGTQSATADYSYPTSTTEAEYKTLSRYRQRAINLPKVS